MSNRIYLSSLAASMLVTLAALGSAACSDGDASPQPGRADAGATETPADAGPRDDASAAEDAQTDAAAPLPDAATEGAAATPPDAATGNAFISNPPGLAVVDVGSPATPQLVLRSSNLVQHPDGDRTYVEWFAEVENVGDETLCLVEVDARFADASGGELEQLSTHVRAEPYAAGALTVPCLAPGKVGGIYANHIAAVAIPLDQVKTLALRLSPADIPGAVPDPAAPHVDSHVDSAAEGFAARGVLTASSLPIRGIAVDVFPRDPRGLVVGFLSASREETLPAKAAWSYTTERLAQSFATYGQYVTYTRE